MSLSHRLLGVTRKAEQSCDGLLSWATSRCCTLSSEAAARRRRAGSAALPKPQETRPTGCPLPSTAQSGQDRAGSALLVLRTSTRALDRLRQGCCPSIAAQGCAQSQARGCVCHRPQCCQRPCCCQRPQCCHPAAPCQAVPGAELLSHSHPVLNPSAARTHSEGSAVGCH